MQKSRHDADRRPRWIALGMSLWVLAVAIILIGATLVSSNYDAQARYKGKDRDRFTLTPSSTVSLQPDRSSPPVTDPLDPACFNAGMDYVVTYVRPWFTPCSLTASSVEVHYTFPGTEQFDVPVPFNKSNGRWEMDIAAVPGPGEQVKYSFTYIIDEEEYETDLLTWTQPSGTTPSSPSPLPSPSPSLTTQPPGAVFTQISPPAMPSATETVPASTNSGMTPDEWDAAQQLFQRVNQDRIANNRDPVTWNDALAQAAYKHSVEMSTCGMSHQCPGEPKLGQRISNEGVSWSTCGENVGWSSGYGSTWKGVEANQNSMMAEVPPDDGHLQNMLNPDFTSMGIGIFVAPDGKVWLTQDFMG